MKKISSMFQSVSYWIGVMVIGVVVGISLQFASAAWTNPTLPPPTGNVDAPINTGNNLQNKAGSLGISGFLDVLNNAIVHGRLGIGTNNPAYLLHAVGTSSGENGIAVEGNGQYAGLQVIQTGYNNKYGGPEVAHFAWNSNLQQLEIASDKNIDLGSNEPGAKVYGPDFCIKGTSNCLSGKSGEGTPGGAEAVYKRAGTDYCGGTAFMCHLTSLNGSSIEDMRFVTWQASGRGGGRWVHNPTETETSCDWVLCTQ